MLNLSAKTAGRKEHEGKKPGQGIGRHHDGILSRVQGTRRAGSTAGYGSASPLPASTWRVPGPIKVLPAGAAVLRVLVQLWDDGYAPDLAESAQA